MHRRKGLCWTAKEVLGKPLPLCHRTGRTSFSPAQQDHGKPGIFGRGSHPAAERRSRFHASLSAAAIYDERGEIIGIMGSAADITHRKEAEEKVKESEETYRNLFQTRRSACSEQGSRRQNPGEQRTACKDVRLRQPQRIDCGIPDFSQLCGLGDPGTDAG